jgi:hypothetical protein
MTFPIKVKMHPVAVDTFIDSPDAASSRSRCGPITTNSSDTAPSGPKKRYMIIDETKLPNDEAERLLAKRAYNRECADRARKRSKETVKELLQHVQELYAEKVELRRMLAAKEKEIQLLKDKYKALLLINLTQTQAVDIYPHNNSIGLSTETWLPFNADSLEHQPFSSLPLSLMERQGSGDRVRNCPQETSTSLPPSWYLH